MPNDSQSRPKPRIAIIGGGIAGLTLTLALQSSQISTFDIDIYEAAPEFSEIGAGINIWPRTWDIFKSIGLDKPLANLLERYPDYSPALAFQLRKSDQKEGIAVRDLIMNGGALRFHRAELQRALLDQISTTTRIHLSKRLKSYTEGANIDLMFEDGFTTSCDLLIGADGIKSTVRRSFLTRHGTPEDLGSINPIWTGSVAYRGIVPVGELERQFPGHRATKVPVMYCGKDKHLIVYPVSHGKQVNVVAMHNSEPEQEGTFLENAPVTSIPQADMLSIFAGWEEEVQGLLRCIEFPTKWHLHTLIPISKYAAGRVILMGDAAHAMTPHLGAGAGQGIEDAYVLAALIAKAGHNSTKTTRIAEIYDSIRRPFANQILVDSRTQGFRSQLIAPGFENVKEGDPVPVAKLQALFEDMTRAWDWMSTTSPKNDHKRAVDMMLSLV